ncbi:MAG TPA: hypothetical protein VF175_04195, partial [Lacipirellula sp.]
MNALAKKLCTMMTMLACLTIVATSPALADPLDGRDVLKFSQQPMDGTPITNPNGVTQRFWGHDE